MPLFGVPLIWATSRSPWMSTPALPLMGKATASVPIDLGKDGADLDVQTGRDSMISGERPRPPRAKPERAARDGACRYGSGETKTSSRIPLRSSFRRSHIDRPASSRYLPLFRIRVLFPGLIFSAPFCRVRYQRRPWHLDVSAPQGTPNTSLHLQGAPQRLAPDERNGPHLRALSGARLCCTALRVVEPTFHHRRDTA